MEKCEKCKQQFSSRNSQKIVVKCSFCAKYFHAKCDGIDEKTCYYINESDQVIWSCIHCDDKRGFVVSFITNLDKMRDICSGQQKAIENLSILVRQQGENINVLRQEVKNCASSGDKPTNVSGKRTFSSLINGENNFQSPAKRPKAIVKKVQKTIPRQKEKESVIVIKHVNGENHAKQIEEKIKSNFNPDVDNVDSLKVTKNNKVVVRCREESSYNSIRDKIAKIMGENYSVNKPRESNLVLLFRDVPKHWKDDASIKLQMSKKEELKEFVNKIEVFRISQYGTAYVKCCDEETYNALLSKNKLRIEWSVINVRAYTDLRRCYKCQEYNHRGNECTNKQACAQCSGEHDVTKCESNTICCINCTRAGSSNSRVHCVWSFKCPVLQERLKFLEKI